MADRVAQLLWLGSVALVLAAAAPGAAVHGQAAGRTVILATTTSTRDTGLLDSLVPIFERERGYQVLVVAVGSGQALEMARRGDADVVLAHSPDDERRLEAGGFVRNRRPVMHNDFVIVGPPGDPAGIRGLTSAAGALRRIAARRDEFISRGDRSGTHARELELWRRAGVVPRGRWYLEVGQGMGVALTIAQERRAYTLSDRGTYLAWRGRHDLEVLVQGDTALYNQYHVMEVNPANAPRVNEAGGRAFAEFLVRPSTQRLIAQFGVSRFGRPLFVPDAVPER